MMSIYGLPLLVWGRYAYHQFRYTNLRMLNYVEYQLDSVGTWKKCDRTNRIGYRRMRCDIHLSPFRAGLYLLFCVEFTTIKQEA